MAESMKDYETELEASFKKIEEGVYSYRNCHQCR